MSLWLQAIAVWLGATMLLAAYLVSTQEKEEKVQAAKARTSRQLALSTGKATPLLPGGR